MSITLHQKKIISKMIKGKKNTLRIKRTKQLPKENCKDDSQSNT